MTIISPFLTFPNISWWMQVMAADVLVLDKGEHFVKMTVRNRYDIAGANNAIKLSVPLVNGRNQHIPMHEVKIHNGEKWQTQHWRTLVSAYNRTPYFDHYALSLQPLFETEYVQLTDFNRATIEWVRKQMKLKFELQETDTYTKEYPEEIADLRGYKSNRVETPKYYRYLKTE